MFDSLSTEWVETPGINTWKRMSECRWIACSCRPREGVSGRPHRHAWRELVNCRVAPDLNLLEAQAADYPVIRFFLSSPLLSVFNSLWPTFIYGPWTPYRKDYKFSPPFLTVIFHRLYSYFKAINYKQFYVCHLWFPVASTHRNWATTPKWQGNTTNPLKASDGYQWQHFKNKSWFKKL